MYVIKRSGAKAPIDIQKITNKISYFNKFPSRLTRTDVPFLVDEVVKDLHNNIKTSEIDDYTAKRAVELSLVDPQYMVLGSRIAVNNLHKATQSSFKDKMTLLYNRVDTRGIQFPLIERTFYKYVCAKQREIEAMIDYTRDYLIEYAGLLTLIKSYLLKLYDKIVERPQDMYMRVAIALCMNTKDFDDEKALERIKLTYDLLSLQACSHASPTMFNAGTNHGQLSSCFLLGSGDSRREIQRTMDSVTSISKRGGGVGIHISDWRSAGSLIRGTNGLSKGNGNFLRAYNAIGNAYDQGGNRKGSIAVFLETHHPDIITFLDLKKPLGAEEQRARDLFYGLMVSDLFMKRVTEDGDWYLLDPDECPGLNKTHNDEYEALYTEYVKKGAYRKKMKARELWQLILENQIITGTPYLIAKDAANRTNNLGHYSLIQTSNLCSEILLPATTEEYGVCTLAAIILPRFVCSPEELKEEDHLKRIRTPDYLPYKKIKGAVFDFKGLAAVVRVVVRNLDHLIDINKYPVDQAGISNFLHRPLGLGVSGLADVYCMMGYPFESEDAALLNKLIFETIAYAAYTESSQLAKERRHLPKPDMEAFFSEWEEFKGRINLVDKLKNLSLRQDTLEQGEIKALEEKVKNMPFFFTPRVRELTTASYPSYYYGEGARHRFQWECWKNVKHSGMWDWESLAAHVDKFGLRNSLLTACMPTASTAHIVSVNEGIEPFTSNVYRRKLLAGDVLIFNKYLIEDMIECDLWNEQMAEYLKVTEGSIQDIVDCPQYLKDLYKTAWEIKQRSVINQARDRAPYIDHTQSMNLFVRAASVEKISSMLRYAWETGLKTLIYYLRTQPAAQPIKFSLSVDAHKLILDKGSQYEREKGKIVIEEETCLGCGV